MNGGKALWLVDNVQADLNCALAAANQTTSAGNALAKNASGDSVKRFSDQAPGPAMQSGSVTLSGAIGTTGGGQAHSNMQPWIAINYCIALDGLFPSRP